MNNIFRTSISALSTTVAISSLFWPDTASASWLNWSTPDAAASASIQTAANTSHDGIFLGRAYDAYWGNVQVQATIKNGRLTAVDVPQYPDHRNTSRSINRQALPMLLQEVIKAQSTRVNTISGATLTSDAYLKSLRSALKKAGY